MHKPMKKWVYLCTYFAQVLDRKWAMKCKMDVCLRIFFFQKREDVPLKTERSFFCVFRYNLFRFYRIKIYFIQILRVQQKFVLLLQLLFAVLFRFYVIYL